MNILIVFSQPWRVGGAETHVEALIKGLSEHKVILVVNEGSNKEKLINLQKTNPHIKVEFIQARGINIFRWARDIFKLIRVVKENEINIISAQQRTAGLWAYIISKFTGVQFIVTMHDAWHRALCKTVYHNIFPHIVAVGKHLSPALIEKFKFDKKQISFISNGIDFNVFKPGDMLFNRKALGLSSQSKVILHVSRLSDIKGAVSIALIDSMKYITGEMQDVRLIIIGEGPLRRKIENLAKEFNVSHGNIIEVRNFTDQIITWYNAADLVVGEGRVAIEALACEKALIAIRNNAKFFGTVTIDNLADAIDVNFDGSKYVVSGEVLAQEINKAACITLEERKNIKQEVSSRLGISKMANKYMGIFERVYKQSENEV